MKFAHDFKQTLASQGFPSHWINHAIPYSQLKKCLKKVQQELNDLGLDQATLQSLLDPDNTSPVALKYRLKSASGSEHVRPKLTVLVHMQDGVAVDASLTTASRRFVEKLAAELPPDRRPSLTATQDDNHPAAQSSVPAEDPSQSLELSKQGSYERIEVPLVFDSEFFEILQSDVSSLETLQEEEQKNMTSEIVELGKEVTTVTKPRRMAKNDLSRWRDIFELYLDAQVFFATQERNHGARSSQAALQQLQWFQGQVEKKQLAKKFQVRESNRAFSRFLNINALMLKHLQFQELNKTAVFKILKKFDKRTSFGISKSFSSAIRSDRLMTGNMAKDLCAQLSNEFVSVIPQLDDYLCPICFAIAFRTVRLECQHIFCVRCVIKMQRQNEKHCPMCRAPSIESASLDNIDHELEKYLKKYFPKETKEKLKANQMERGVELYGQSYNNDCSVM